MPNTLSRPVIRKTRRMRSLEHTIRSQPELVADELEAPDEDAEAGRVEEGHLVEVDDEVGAAGRDLLVEGRAQLGGGVDVDLSGDRHDADVVLSGRGHGQLHWRGSLLIAAGQARGECRDRGLP